MDEPNDSSVDDALARRAAGLEWTGRLAQGVAHDLANLLMVVGSRARFALSALPPDSEARVHVEEAVSAASAAATLVRHLSRSAATPAWRPQLVDLNGLIASLQPLLATLFRNRIELQVAASARQGVAYIDGSRLERTLLDLAFDHSDAAQPTGAFSIATMTRELDDRIAASAGHSANLPHTLIAVSCAGSGDASALLDRLLRHWNSGDELSAVLWRTHRSACARLPHDAGYILAEHAREDSRITIYVPPPSASDTPQVPARTHKRLGAARTVLVAENDDSIRRVITRSLHGRGYAILEAANGAAALALADIHGAPIDVLVTDIDMPGMTGRELAKALREIHPDLLTVFVSGSELDEAAGIDPSEAAAFLMKPFDKAALVQIVATLFDGDSA